MEENRGSPKQSLMGIIEITGRTVSDDEDNDDVHHVR